MITSNTYREEVNIEETVWVAKAITDNYYKELIYNKYRKIVHRYIGYILWRKNIKEYLEKAKDYTQDVFYKLFKDIDKVSTEIPLKAVLFSTAKRIILEGEYSKNNRVNNFAVSTIFDDKEIFDFVIDEYSLTSEDITEIEIRTNKIILLLKEIDSKYSPIAFDYIINGLDLDMLSNKYEVSHKVKDNRSHIYNICKATRNYICTKLGIDIDRKRIIDWMDESNLSFIIDNFNKMSIENLCEAVKRKNRYKIDVQYFELRTFIRDYIGLRHEDHHSFRTQLMKKNIYEHEMSYLVNQYITGVEIGDILQSLNEQRTRKLDYDDLMTIIRAVKLKRGVSINEENTKLIERYLKRDNGVLIEEKQQLIEKAITRVESEKNKRTRNDFDYSFILKEVKEIKPKKEDWNYATAQNSELLPDENLHPIQGFKGYYITKYGRVFHEKKNGNLKKLFINYNKSFNKCYIQISVNRRIKTFILHRLVAEYFIPNPNNYPDVLFINGSNEDCRVDNLFWGRQLVNIPTWNPETEQKGETCIFNTKLTEVKVLEIYGNHTDTMYRIAKNYNVSWGMVKMIKEGRRWGWLTKSLISQEKSLNLQNV